MALGGMIPKLRTLKNREFKDPVTATGVPTTISPVATRGVTSGVLVQGASSTNLTIPTPTNAKIHPPKVVAAPQSKQPSTTRTASCREALYMFEKMADTLSYDELEALSEEVLLEVTENYGA